MDSIEITDIDETRKGVNVDFADGDTLVNFTFRAKDLEMLKKLVADLEEELEYMEEKGLL
jgi:hypothetical protein